MTSDQHRMREQLEAMEAGSYEKLQAYLEEGRRLYELGLPRLVEPGRHATTCIMAQYLAWATTSSR